MLVFFLVVLAPPKFMDNECARSDDKPFFLSCFAHFNFEFYSPTLHIQNCINAMFGTNYVCDQSSVNYYG